MNEGKLGATPFQNVSRVDFSQLRNVRRVRDADHPVSLASGPGVMIGHTAADTACRLIDVVKPGAYTQKHQPRPGTAGGGIKKSANSNSRHQNPAQVRVLQHSQPGTDIQAFPDGPASVRWVLLGVLGPDRLGAGLPLLGLGVASGLT